MKSYNLRGTNGSGKTFVARELLKQSEAEPYLFLGAKIAAYKGKLFDVPFYIIGSYATQCGGCDTIPKVALVADILRELMTNNDMFNVYTGPGIVFFEGLMISHMLGTVGEMQKQLGKQHNVLAFLDTPLDLCVQRVMLRRAARGDERPFDPKNVIKDHPRVKSCMENAIRYEYRVQTVNHQDALNQVLHDLEILSKEVS
jgi:uridine kinase